MKKVIILAAAAILSAGITYAQDFEKATNLAKDANEKLVAGDAAAAIDGFKAALAEAEQCSEEAAPELVNTCRTAIVQAHYKMVNDLIDAGNFKEALAKAKETIAVAQEYGEAEVEEKANEKVDQLNQALANAEIKAAAGASDPAEKKAHYEEASALLDVILASDPDNAKTLLQKGQVLSALGQKDAAIEAFVKARENGQEAAANKQLSNIYLKEAQSLLKAKNFDGCIEAAVKSNEYLENANAYRLAGMAANSKKDLNAAYEYFSKYLTLKPNDAQIKQVVDAIKANLKK